MGCLPFRTEHEHEHARGAWNKHIVKYCIGTLYHTLYYQAMARSPPILLQPKKFQQLMSYDPHHPLIRRHLAMSKLAQTVAADLYLHLHKTKLTNHSVPDPVRSIINHLNHHYLSLPTDMKLIPKNAWRLLYRHIFLHPTVPTPPTPQPNHRIIYVQERRWTDAELEQGRQNRTTASCNKPLGSDYNEIQTFTSINQSDCDNMIYVVSDLHARHHGSMSHHDLDTTNILLDFIEAEHSEINKTKAGKTGVMKKNGIIAAFPASSILTDLENNLQFGGTRRFHHDLLSFMLDGGVIDTHRMSNKIDPSLPSANERCRFGFGRVQPRRNKSNWKLSGERMPTLDVEQFLQMPYSLRQQFMTVVEQSQKFLLEQHKDAFSDVLQNQNCASILNRALGFPHSTSKFEYFDIVLSGNISLNKHIDTKNDHRIGYNHCSIYSFYYTLYEMEYKVSIVMVTRTAIGAPIERNHSKHNK